ncbi:hypothetical protein SYNPS1DRAFT_22983 [Syncephalis pseudoplumigaleata]|uniref:VHS domain-containing protein n=1 Tax=Syncephalis pseudoplumigaleata TaxID=1712513 RepID=A0A4P9YY16_9FUNG|nr:hypothetical protein SYNPS1DRAFT_22983 [Syncephalis pseudoplumigaleata]|eukprot:RKP24986.1 hypothetical protein SYNPS1DRAFT_22983 [Syncephalis pseudoplumigaleata]
MTRLSNMFSSSNPVSQAIDTATTPRASQEEDWQLIIDICNMVNSRPEGAKEAAKAVRKRIKSKQANIQLLAITVAQSLFDNCGIKYRVAISTSKFAQTLAELMSSPDTDPAVQSKLYVAITAWAEALRGEPGMEAIPNLYDNLNTITSLTDGNAGANRPRRPHPEPIENMSPEKLEQEITRMGEVCRNSVQMLSESLVYTDPDTEDIRSNELIQASEFYNKCRGLHMEIGRYLSFADTEPYRVTPPTSNVSQNPFDDILAYSDVTAAEAQLGAPMTPMASMPAAPLLPKPSDPSPMGWHVRGMASTSTDNTATTAAPVVTRDEHGNQHAII